MGSKSNCPVNLALEVFGDKWTLLIIRDLMFNGKRSYGEFLQSDEKIATNILGDRLSMLEKEGIVVKRKDPDHKQKFIYSLTEKGIDFLPILVQIGAWSLKYKPVNPKDKAHIKKLLGGGEELLKEIKQHLIKTHVKQTELKGSEVVNDLFL